MKTEAGKKRYICIHGHFYQPPREDPWSGKIEEQPTAHPFHDWNQRISVECYAPNAAARILGPDGQVRRFLNNYSHMSFNFGPTLLRWMEAEAPDTYAAVIQADQESQAIFSGHGSAIAQAYHHSILPLANTRDKYTEVFWGIADFAHRFGRQPEGMWLAETAVNTDTLEVLAELGIRFTILSPFQAGRIRNPVTAEWEDVSGGLVDTRLPYKAILPSGREIAIFFYDGVLAKNVAFEGLLHDGSTFFRRFFDPFSDEPGIELSHIATDGESYGHHHRFGEMALAFALDAVRNDRNVNLTVYGEFLALHPPTIQVEIVEDSAWSCAHGIGRWQTDCGCETGGQAGWTQAWREPLRESLNWLRDAIASLFDLTARRYVKDPWQARNDYINLLLDDSPTVQAEFFNKWAAGPLVRAEKERVLKLMEMQRQALMMFTSCGWFFNDLAGIETLQILRYAARAIELAEELFGEPLEAGFLNRIAAASSNDPLEGNGRDIYLRHIKSVRSAAE